MTWDEYYLKVCNAVAENSKCLSRKIGAILVKDKSIISTGYNGPPRGISKCDKRAFSDKELMKEYLNKNIAIKGDNEFSIPKDICPRYALGYKSGEGLKWCVAGHAERNVLINAARNGICTKGTKMYMNCSIPCSPCLVEIINAGVSEIICTGTEKDYYDVSAKYLLKNSKLKWRIYAY